MQYVIWKQENGQEIVLWKCRSQETADVLLKLAAQGARTDQGELRLEGGTTAPPPKKRQRRHSNSG